MVAAIDRCYYVTRRGDVSDFRDRLHRPCKRALAFFNSSKLNSFVRCREHRPSSIRASLIIARWNAAFRSNPLLPHLSSRQLASIRIADPVKSRDWGRTLEKPWVSRFCPAARGFSIIKVRFFPRFRAHGGKSEKMRNFISVCESRNARRTKIESIDFLIHYMTFLSLSPSLSLRYVLNVINLQICEIKLLRLYIRNKRWEYQ